MAEDIKRIVLQFTGESEDAKSDMEQIFALLSALDHVDVEAKAGIATAGAKADFAEIMALVDILDHTDVEVNVDIQTQKLSLATRLFRAFGITTGNADKGLEEFTSGIQRLNVNLPGALGRLNAVSGAAFALAIAVGVTLVGALGALIASLGAAVAGLAALGAAFAAALGPAVLLVVGVVQRLAAVWKVLKQEDQAQLQAQQNRVQGNRAIQSALEQQASAATQLKRANEDLGTATAAAYQQMEDAAQRATDAILGLQRAQLNQQDAALGIERAKLELKKFIAEMKVGQRQAAALFNKFTDVAFDPSKLNKQLAKVKIPGATGLDKQEQELKLKELIFGIKDARLREKEATNQVTHAITEKTRADQQNMKFMREGIKASPQYVAALRSVADAHRAVAKAAQGLADAKTVAASAKAQAMTDQLSAKEKILLGILKQVRDAFKQTFGPGIQATVAGIAGGLSIIATRIKPLRRSFTTLGKTMGAAIVSIIDHFTSPRMISSFANFTKAATALLAPLTSIFQSLGDILLNIANATLPLLLPLIEQVATWFSNLADKTSDIGRVRDIVAILVEHFVAWWNLLKTFGAIILEFFKQAAPLGLDLADAFTRGGKAMLGWMQSEQGRQQIREFLAVAVPFAKRFVGFIGQVFLLFIRLGQVVGPILGPLLDLFTAMLGLSNRLLRVVAKITNAIGDVASLFTRTISKLIDKLGGFIGDFIQLGIDFIGGIIKGIGKKAGDLLDFVGKLGKKVLDKLKHPWKILSPSKVTQGYGENLVQGLINGIQGAAKQLQVAAEVSLVSPILDPLKAGQRAAPMAARAAAAVAGPGGGGDIVIEKQDIHLQSAGGNIDPRAGAVQIGTELRRSARKGRRG